MHAWSRSVRLAAPILLFAAGVPAPLLGAGLVSYNVILHKVINDYQGVNDCWGYTAPDGTEIAIYGHQLGTSFVDATDPASAVEVFNLPGPSSTWRDMKTYLHYAYIVTEGSASGTGLQIVDLSNPLAPVHVRTYTDNNFTTAHNIWIDTGAGIAYACGAAPGGGMHILSLADPENPVELDFFNPYYIHDLYVKDGVAYAGAINSGTLRIIDVSDPSHPVTIATHSYPGATTHSAWPNLAGTHCCTADEVAGGHLKIWDISDLGNISFAAEWMVTSENAIIHNVLLENDMAYLSYYTAGTRIIDVTDPTNPVEVGFYDTSTRNGGFDGNWGVYPFRADNVFYSSDRQEGLFILEFTGGFAGEIRGTIRDALTQAPLDSAYVDVGGLQTLATGPSGTYSGFFSGGTYTVITTRFAYTPDTASVVIPEQGTQVHDVDLQPLAVGAVELHLSESGTGLPVAGAICEVLDTPLTGLVSDASGSVTANGLPEGIPWTIRVGKFGRKLTDVVVTAVADSTILVDVELVAGFSDDFDFDQAWIAGAVDDDATGGVWERAIPVGSYYQGIVGPEEDASPSGAGYAYVTEQHVEGAWVGSSDVDNGKTTLFSPVFDGAGLGTLLLSYNRWFSNRAPVPGNDEFRADVSTDGGMSWTNLETLSVGTDSWAQVNIDLSALVSPTSQMQLRFVAEDQGADQYVEAGLDDVEISSSATTAPRGSRVLGRVRLLRPSPNPFREETTIAFELPEAQPVSVAIYDVSGRRTAVLLRGERVGAGTHRLCWKGNSAEGGGASPGVYFVRLETPGGVRSRKLVLLR